jgi:hypothetical protein
MKPKTTFFLALLHLTPMAAVQALASEVPQGWFKAGNKPEEYDMGLDSETRHEGRASAFIKSTAAELHGFGTLMQTADASAYRGKRVRFSGFVKSEKVLDGWAGLWLRIDGAVDPNTRRPPALGFDNMQSRSIKGTTDWTRYEIVLDVPPEAETLNFGLLLDRDGKVWMDSLSFEVVGNDVKVTAAPPPARTPPPPPQNLAFDQGLQPLGTVRTILSAQAYYKSVKPDLGYACDFAPLVAANALSNARTWEKEMDGYRYLIVCPDKKTPQATHRVFAVAVGTDAASRPAYCANETGAIFKVESGLSYATIMKDDGKSCFEKGTPVGK